MLTRVAILTMVPVLGAVVVAPGIALAASESLTLAICSASGMPPEILYQQDYFVADGTVESLVLTRGDVSDTDCKSTSIQADGKILWAGQASPEHLESYITQTGLQGVFTGDSFRVSEILAIGEKPEEVNPAAVVDAAVPVPPLPLDESVLHQFEPRLFGIEERATVPEQNHLACVAGSQLAGAFFYSQRPWAAGHTLQLEIRARGEGRFNIALGDAVRDQNQNPLDLGTIDLDIMDLGTDEQDTQASQIYRFNVPDNNLPWTSLTVTCPPEPGSLVLLSLQMRSSQDQIQDPTRSDSPALSALPAAEQALTRGAWFWSADLWSHNPQFIWQSQAQQQLSEIYISVDVDNSGQITNQAQLAQFISDAHARLLQVWVVAGDPHDVLQGNQTALENRVNAVLNYNNSVAQNARLAGIQLDIEPYLLSGFARTQALWRQRYVAVIQQIHQMVGGQMTLDLVMPAWWGRHQVWGEQLFSQLPASNTRISVMNYHTAAERLRQDAEPFLNWGQQSGVPIQMGLESGYLQDESQRRYRSHEDTGELWLLTAGGQPVLVLFEQPQQNLPGKAFVHAFEYAVPASLYTFAGDMTRLNQVLAELESEWRAWSSFSGVAIHGLDDKNYNEGAR